MKSNNQINVPQAKAAMEQFKRQAPSAARWSKRIVPYNSLHSIEQTALHKATKSPCSMLHASAYKTAQPPP